MSVIFATLVVFRCFRLYCCFCAGAKRRKQYDKISSAKADRNKSPTKRKLSSESVIPIVPAVAASYQPVRQIVGGETSAVDCSVGVKAVSVVTASTAGAELELGAKEANMTMEEYEDDSDEERGGIDIVGQPSPYMREMKDIVDASPDLSPPPRRNLQLHTMKSLHAAHRNEELLAYNDYRGMPLPVEDGPVVAPGLPKVQLMGEKTSSALERCGVVLNNTRIPYFDWTLGNVATVIVYLGINALCLLLAPEKNIGRGLGSLAAANTMLLVIPACRNSILSMGLSMPFDRVVYLHRFIGRFAVGCVFAHGYFYIDTYYTSNYAFVTGAGALICSAIIFLTSMNFFRREYFNLFFWSHYSFVVYIVLVYVHVEQTKPFIIVAVALYLFDKFLRCVWTLWPHRTLLFKNRSDAVAQVRFPKNPLTRALGFHDVGQYYFVNFPALSLTEWHPFSVSSGPREDSVELHIRDLGDHTKRIVEFSKLKAKTNEHTWILIDGPYGNQSFNYRQ